MAVPSIRAWNPTFNEEQAFRSTDESLEWLCNLPAPVLRQYAGKWVAVRECSIAASADTMAGLLDLLGDSDLTSLIIDRIEHPGWVVYR